MSKSCYIVNIWLGKNRVPWPRELSRENVVYGKKTSYFNILPIISLKDYCLICLVSKFQDVWFTRSNVTADSLGRKIGDSPCILNDEFETDSSKHWLFRWFCRSWDVWDLQYLSIHIYFYNALEAFPRYMMQKIPMIWD